VDSIDGACASFALRHRCMCVGVAAQHSASIPAEFERGAVPQGCGGCRVRCVDRGLPTALQNELTSAFSGRSLCGIFWKSSGGSSDSSEPSLRVCTMCASLTAAHNAWLNRAWKSNACRNSSLSMHVGRKAAECVWLQGLGSALKGSGGKHMHDATRLGVCGMCRNLWRVGAKCAWVWSAAAMRQYIGVLALSLLSACMLCMCVT
jgi:hypothetical protein